MRKYYNTGSLDALSTRKSVEVKLIDFLKIFKTDFLNECFVKTKEIMRDLKSHGDES